MIAQLDSLYVKTRPTKAIARVLSRVLFEGRPVPARGQWTNHLNRAFLEIALHTRSVRPVRKPIFILGSGRSGTTILAKVLSMHRDVGLLNEPKLLWHVAYPAEDLAGSYSRGPARYRLGPEAATEDVRRAVHRMYGFYLSIVRAERVLDKYPEMIFRVPFVLSILPDAKLVFIVRNGLDAARSVAWWCERYSRTVRNGDRVTWWGVNDRKWNLLVEQVLPGDPILAPLCPDIERLSREVDRAAVEWVATVREGLRAIEQAPQSIQLVRYEELASQPRNTLRRLAEFCELSQDPLFFEYGSQVLTARPAGRPLEIDEAIAPIFRDTMRRMGYLEDGQEL